MLTPQNTHPFFYEMMLIFQRLASFDELYEDGEVVPT